MSVTSLASRRRRREQDPDERSTSDRIEVLLKREAPALLAYFERRVRPAEDAADLLSETLIVTCRRAAVVPDDEQHARMWLFGVARNVLATHRRGQIRRDALAAQLPSELGSRPTSVQGPEASSGPRVAQLQDLIADLPDVDREILALVVWDGFTLAEVAALLGMPAGTVRSRFSRARSSLRAEMERTSDR